MIRLLVVDDEEAIVRSLARYFRQRGFEVDVGRELEEAMVLLAERPYDAILTDLRLRSREGAEGLNVLAHAKERHPRTRTILLTAHLSKDVETEARALGVDLVLRKPIPLKDLGQRLLKLMSDSE